MVTKDFVASFVASAQDSPRSLPSPPLDGRVLNVRQVAERLNVSTAVVYSLIERGELEHFRIRNAIKVTPAALVRFIKGAMPHK